MHTKKIPQAISFIEINKTLKNLITFIFFKQSKYIKIFDKENKIQTNIVSVFI